MFKAPTKSQETLDFEAANQVRKDAIIAQTDAGIVSEQLLAEIESYNQDFYKATKTTGYCISKKAIKPLTLSSESRVKILAGSKNVGDTVEMNPINRTIKSFGASWEEKVSEGAAAQYGVVIGSTQSFQYAYLADL